MSLLQVSNLVHHFQTPRGLLQAVRGVDFLLEKSQTMALVGESGSGKSTTARAVARLVEPTAGQVVLNGEDILQAGYRKMRALRRDIQVVFQDPNSSLDPLFTVGRSIREPLDIYRIGTASWRTERVRELLDLVSLGPLYHDRFPASLSGGQKQRVAIARSLALNPKVVICDEAVSALDVSVQAQVLNLLSDLQARFGVAYLFITHDLAVVSEIADCVAVMFLGRIVETGSRSQVLAAPQHPYTQVLLSAASRVGSVTQRIVLAGEAPSAFAPPSGCSFRMRCPRAQALCASIDPPLMSAGSGGLDSRAAAAPTHQVACHFPG